MKSVKNKLVVPPHQGISLFVNATVLTKMRNELIWPRAWIKRSVTSPVLDKTIDFDSDKPNKGILKYLFQLLAKIKLI